MKEAIKQSVYMERLRDPICTQKQIGERLGLPEYTVSRALKSMMGTHDRQLRQMLAGKFLEEFQMASDYWKRQITLLEELKKESTSTDEIIKIMREQSDRWEKVLFLARQGEAVEVMRLMKQDGERLPETN